MTTPSTGFVPPLDWDSSVGWLNDLPMDLRVNLPDHSGCVCGQPTDWNFDRTIDQI